MDLTPFIIESVLLTFAALILEAFSLRQIIFNITKREGWRSLIASHYLTQLAGIILLIASLDSQGGLGLYSQAVVLFLTNVKGFILIAAGRALAAGFVDSHKLMTKGPQGPPLGLILLVAHSMFLVVAIALSTVLMVTRDTWIAVAMRCLLSLYSIVVGVQVVTSTLKVRTILVDEHARTGKYVDGIRKLNRLATLVVVLLLVSNISIFVALGPAVNLAKNQSQLSEEQPPFLLDHIAADLTSLFAQVALLLGSWSVGRKEAGYTSRRSTAFSTTNRSAGRDTASTAQKESTGGSVSRNPDVTVEVQNVS